MSSPSYILIALLLAVPSCGERTEHVAENKPTGLVVENPSGDRPFYHLFGTVPVGEMARHVFELRNTDDQPITVHRIQAACGCTMPSVKVREQGGNVIEGNLLDDGEPIVVVPPKGVLEIEFRIDTKSVPQKNGWWLATAHMTTDAVASAYVHFEMSILVDSPLQITPATIDLGDTPVSTGAWGVATAITAVPGAKLSIEGIAMTSPELEAEIEVRDHFGQSVWEIRVDLEPGLPLGAYRGEVRVNVVDEPMEGVEARLREIAIPVRALVVEDIVARPAVLALSAVQGSSEVSGEARIVSLVPGRRIVVTDAVVAGVPEGSVAVDLEPIVVDALGRAQEWTARLRVVGPIPGPRFVGTVEFRVDEPEGPSRVQLRFSGSAP